MPFGARSLLSVTRLEVDDARVGLLALRARPERHPRHNRTSMVIGIGPYRLSASRT